MNWSMLRLCISLIIRLSEDIATLSTFTETCADNPDSLSLQVTIAVPFLRPLTTPSWVTITTALLLLVHWKSYTDAEVIAGATCGTRV